MADKLTQDVQTAVDAVFKKKEEETLRAETENALKASADKIMELSSSLEAKENEVTTLRDEIETLTAEVEALTSVNEELTSNLEKANTEFEAKEQELLSKAEEAETKLANLEKDLQAKARFEELKNEGVAASDEKAVKAQIAKIRDMDDEEFIMYKTERIDLRKAILADLEKNTKSTDQDDDHDAAASGDAVSDGGDVKNTDTSKNDVDDTDTKAKADVDIALASSQAMASMLNLEQVPAEDILSKYKELGKALAETMK